MAGAEQLRVEFLQIPRFRHRHPMIAPEVTGLALDPAFLVRLRRCAEVALETPVRAGGDKARGFLAAMAAQNLPHRALEVVVSEQSKNSTKIMERVLVSLEKRLLGGTLIGPMEGYAARHAAQRKYLQQRLHPIEFRPRLVPIDLAFLARRVA